jgi:aminopeptidase S
MMKRDLARGALLLSLVLCPAVSSAQDAARLTETITAMSAGHSSVQRRDVILTRLSGLGVDAAQQPFGQGDRSGVNIVVTLPGSDPRIILVGAHYDRVKVGQGVVDNGGSCATLIELIGAFKASPLGRFTLKFVFFDQEEAGLLGSKAYFAANAERPVFAMNLDVFAYGNEFFVTASKRDGALVRALQAAASADSLPVRDAAVDRYPGSDHRSMISAGLETVGIALVDTADIDGVLAIGGSSLKVGKGPRIMSIIHTPGDTLAELRVADVARAIPVLERTIRTLDRAD